MNRRMQPLLSAAQHTARLSRMTNLDPIACRAVNAILSTSANRNSPARPGTMRPAPNTVGSLHAQPQHPSLAHVCTPLGCTAGWSPCLTSHKLKGLAHTTRLHVWAHPGSTGSFITSRFRYYWLHVQQLEEEPVQPKPRHNPAQLRRRRHDPVNTEHGTAHCR